MLPWLLWRHLNRGLLCLSHWAQLLPFISFVFASNPTQLLKEIIMSYSDCITIAAHHAFNNDNDVPNDLLGNTIVSEAAMLAGLDSDRIGCAAWD